MNRHVTKIAGLAGLFFLISAPFILFTGPQRSYAQGNIKAGNFEIHPSFAVKETYNSNLFSEADGSGESPDSDWFTTVTPGIAFKYPGENVKFDFGYNLDIERYNRFNNENTEKHHIDASLQLISPSQFYSLTLENKFEDTKDPAGSDAQSNANLTRADRVQNSFKGLFTINFEERLKFILDFSNAYGKYDLGALDAENTTKYKFGGAFYYKFLPKTAATINYHLGTVDYRDAVGAENSNSNSHDVKVGLAFDPTAKLFGEATIGFMNINYSRNDFKDGNTFSIAGNLNWQARAKTLINLNASRSLEESSFSGTAAATSSFFTRSSVGLGLTQTILTKITARANVSYVNSDYPVDSRSDNKGRADLDIKYDIREWAFIATNYSYQKNDSNVDSRDYKIHKWSLNIGATF